MKNQKRQKIIIALAVWVIIVAIVALERKDFFYKNVAGKYTYEHAVEEYLTKMGPLLLNPPNKEAMLRNIEVSMSEIDQHRYRYGTKENQLTDIAFQYEGVLTMAKEDGNTARVEQLTKERDAKLADIKKNFEDDEYVKKKILAEKKKIVTEYFKQLDERRRELLVTFSYMSYQLKNTETDEVKSFGDMDAQALKTYSYSKGKQIFTSETYDADMIWLFHDSDYSYWPMLDGKGDKSIANQTHYYQGTIIIDEKKFKATPNYDAYQEIVLKQYIFIAFVVSGVVSLLLLLLMKARITDLYERVTYFHNAKVDAHIAIIATAVMVFMISVSRISNLILTIQTDALLPWLILLVIATWVGMASVNSFIYRVELEGDMFEVIKESYLRKMLIACYDLALNRSLFIQTTILLSCSFIGGVAATLLVNGANGILLFILCFVVGFAGFFLFLARMGYLSRIIKDTEDLAQGKLNRPIAIKGRSPFARHAHNLNELREGVRQSMNEQAKSERLKTELITNVSHDLRTPLTSIITYTELLKNDNLTPEERRQYVDVLDKKSERLKILIEDLFEVSKMASGNMELHKQRLDLTELVTQVVGEHEEDLVKHNLELRMMMPNEPIYVYVDGQKMWRLIDNLMINVRKYALEYTRVYVTLQENEAGQAELAIKNIAKYEIGDNVEELFERFKRADKSRNTEGSGLGLAIAQSIVDMHDAKMGISVDGDLFKVTVNIEKVR